MAQYTITVYPDGWSYSEGDWNNLGDSFNNSQSSYAYTKTLVQLGQADVIIRFPAVSQIPSYATINSVTLHSVIKAEKKVNLISKLGGDTFDSRYGYTRAVRISDHNNLPYQVSTEKSFTISWTNCDFPITTISKDLLSKGFSFYTVVSNLAVTPQTIQVATFALVITYTIAQYKVVIAADEHGEVAIVLEQGKKVNTNIYEHNSIIRVTATPKEGYRFRQWNDGSLETTRRFTITKAVTYAAHFELDDEVAVVKAGNTLSTKVYLGNTTL